MAHASHALPVSQAQLLDEVPMSKPRGMFARTLARVLSDPAGMLGTGILLALTLVALLAPVLARDDPYLIGAGFPLDGPSWRHPFGTDDLGRDVYSRVVYGGRISLTIAIGSAALALAMAVPLGLLAGYLGGFIDAAISRIFDTIFAFPSILIGIGFVAAFGANLRNVVIAVAIINIPTIGRLTRVAILAQMNEEYVEAARSIGASNKRIAAIHILPNALPPLIVQVALVMGEAVLLEAAFSFLGLGSRPPTPSWGVMLNEGRSFLSQAWWLGFFPGLAIMLMILGLNALADALRYALNPRRR